MVIAIPVGLLLGFISAAKKDTVADRVISSLAVTGLSIPVVWSGLMIMLLFSLKMNLFPPSGTGDIRFLILPAITLSLPAVAALSRITRTTVIEVMDMPYITTARAKGMSDIKINLIHMLKNAFIPVITVIGLDFGSYLIGAVLTETIFG
jgi:peptide/nickel transport system permease protein